MALFENATRREPFFGAFGRCAFLHFPPDDGLLGSVHADEEGAVGVPGGRSHSGPGEQAVR